jgi:hypothetical protein
MLITCARRAHVRPRVAGRALGTMSLGQSQRYVLQSTVPQTNPWLGLAGRARGLSWGQPRRPRSRKLQSIRWRFVYLQVGRAGRARHGAVRQLPRPWSSGRSPTSTVHAGRARRASGQTPIQSTASNEAKPTLNERNFCGHAASPGLPVTLAPTTVVPLTHQTDSLRSVARSLAILVNRCSQPRRPAGIACLGATRQFRGALR